MGAGLSVTESIAIDAAKSATGDKTDQIKWGAVVIKGGQVSAEDWNAAQTKEDALEPELGIVDPHHHVWDTRELCGYNLLDIFLQQYYMMDELIEDFIGGGHNISRSVFVETHSFYNADVTEADRVMAPLGEAQFAQGIAAQFASGKYGPLRRACAGIVGSADLEKYGAAVEPLLIACKEQCPNYRGIRCGAAHDPNCNSGSFHQAPGIYSQPKFREGFALLEKLDLVFDAWVFSCQLQDVIGLATVLPGTTIVLNHAGTPVAGLGNYRGAPAYSGKQDAVLEQWRADMKNIAKNCPNVVIKV